ncbi:MAG: amino acid ABC transporter permease [Anaerofustis sp.]
MSALIAIYDVGFAVKSFWDILSGLPTTFFIGTVSCIIGVIAGIFTALIQIYRVPVLRHLSNLYVSIGRGTPLLIQLYAFYYGIPLMMSGINHLFGGTQIYTFQSFPPVITAIVTFAFNVGAYLSVNFYSAITAVDYGQVEAAKSIGMKTGQILRRIVMPQAMVIALPNVSNSFSIMIKATTLVFTITVVEIFARAKIAAALNLKYLEVYTASMIVFWIITLVLEQSFAYFEKKLRQKGIA